MTALELILHLAEGSTTPNTLKHIAKIAKQTIEALDNLKAQHDIADIIAGELKVSRGTAYDLMREALAEAERPCVDLFEYVNDADINASDMPAEVIMKLQSAVWARPRPPRRAKKPLTEERLEELWDEATDRQEHFCSQYWDFARAIEKEHGIYRDK